MGKLIMCIAQSLDGFIADGAGSVDFLFERPKTGPDSEYDEFYENVGAIIFGHNTYKQIVNDISPDKWPYPGKRCYVYTRSAKKAEAKYGDVVFTGKHPRDLVGEIYSERSGNIWLFGGRQIIEAFMRLDLVDCYYIYTVPVLLGEGVPLFGAGQERKDLRLLYTGGADGTVKAFYERVRPE